MRTDPMVEVTLTFVMKESCAKYIQQSAIERVINTSMDIVSETNHEDAGVNYEDWQEAKPIVRAFWSSLQNALFCVRSCPPLVNASPKCTLWKGDIT